MYRSLRLVHERTLNGTGSALLAALARALSRRTGPPVKLHCSGEPRRRERAGGVERAGVLIDGQSGQERRGDGAAICLMLRRQRSPADASVPVNQS